jgi:hypothetical protein
MDAVVIGSILTVVGAVVIVGYLAIRAIHLINTTHSEQK